MRGRRRRCSALGAQKSPPSSPGKLAQTREIPESSGSSPIPPQPNVRMSRAAFYSFDGIAPVSRVGGGAHLNQDIVKHALMRAVEGT